jgi:Tol biopolymer transport system component/DNA-binding winged helix-turn-helix (wHTH) protein
MECNISLVVFQPMSSDKNQIYRFGAYQLDPRERVLKRNDEIIPLPLKPFGVLLVLVEQRGSVVSKEELIRQVWPNSFVEEANLARHIYLLRRTLGEGPEGVKGAGSKRHYIQTIPGRGYRLACEVEAECPEPRVEEHGVIQGDEATAGNGDPSHSRITQQGEEAAVMSERGASDASPGQSRRSWRPSGYHLLAAALILIALVSLSFFFIIPRFRINEPRPEPAISRLTNNGNVLVGSISPDGKYIGAIVEKNAQHSVWVRFIASGGEKQIAPPASFNLGGLVFSPDSSFVYYNGTTKQDGVSTLYQVPIIGGPVRKIKERLNSPASFAPDGLRFAFVREDHARGRSSLLIGSLNDDSEKELIWRETPEFLDYPAWSPDGGRIICTYNNASSARLLEVRLADGAERLLPTPSWRFIRGITWLKDGSGLLVHAVEKFLLSQVWFLAFTSDDDCEPRRVTNGMRVCCGVSVSDDARELVFTEKSRFANVWVAPSTDTSRAMKITSGSGHYEDLTWTPEGRLLYASDANGYWNIWRMDADGSARRQLTFDTYENFSPSASPDGRYIFFTSIRNGFSAIWRMDADGSYQKQLTFDSKDFDPHPSPDGKWAFSTSNTNDIAYALRKVPIDGGQPTPLSAKDIRSGRLSPDGKFVACLTTEGASSPSVWALNLSVISLSDGGVRKLGVVVPPKVNPNQSKLCWTPDSKGIVYADSSDGYRNLWVQPIAGGAPRRLTDFGSDQIFDFDISRDGRLAILRGADKNEIVRISNPNLARMSP